MIGNVSGMNRVGSLLTPLSNMALRSAAFRKIMEKTTGIDRRRHMPEFAGRTFRQWFRSRKSPQESEALGAVVLFADTFTDYNHPEIGRAAVAVLEGLGCRVVVPDTVCCGRPMLSAGMMEQARRNAARNIEALYPHAAEGARIVGLEPSCTLAVSDDYRDLLGSAHEVDLVRGSTVSFDRFVDEALSNGSPLPFENPPKDVRYFGHCHQKAITGTGERPECA